MLSHRRRAALLGALALSLAGCGSGSAPQVTGACTVDAEKQVVLATAQSWYLYQDLLPASVDLNAYSTSAALLDGLTKQAQTAGEDRGWSFLITKQAAQQYFTAGQSAGFGLGLVIDASTNHLLVQQVFGNSPAFTAGFKRGDDILAIGTTAQTLVPMATLLSTSTGLSNALTTPGPGTMRYFQVQPVGTIDAASIVVRSPASALYDLDPVVSKVIATPSGNVGYVHLRTFVSTADDRLRTAFAAFKVQGIQKIIVDVRYNGGGLLDTANVLGSLLHPVGGDLMYRFAFNAKHPDQNQDQKFTAEASGFQPASIAFITTGDSASASELVPNALAAYLGQSLAIVGSRTYGKPVGQASFDLGSSCADALYLISFALQNKDGYGGYYGGLPTADFKGTSCQAADDLMHEQGDAAEASTAAALSFLATGTCGSPIASAAHDDGRPAGGAGRVAASLRPVDPSPAQRDIPGLY